MRQSLGTKVHGQHLEYLRYLRKSPRKSRFAAQPRGATAHRRPATWAAALGANLTVGPVCSGVCRI
eukprot:scaffold55057_cov39-Phaeocystis_antarctica.AAC.1